MSTCYYPANKNSMCFINEVKRLFLGWFTYHRELPLDSVHWILNANVL